MRIVFTKQPDQIRTLRRVIRGIQFLVQVGRIVFYTPDGFLGNDFGLTVTLAEKNVQKQPQIGQKD